MSGFTRLDAFYAILASGLIAAAWSWVLTVTWRWFLIKRNILALCDRAARELDEKMPGTGGVTLRSVCASAYPVIYVVVRAEKGKPVRAWRGLIWRAGKPVETPPVEQLRRKRSMVS